MKEIKFRGYNKDFDGDHFVYGETILFQEYRQQWVMLIENELGEQWVDIKEPQQCVGINDKNGKELYEGDIVHLFGHDTMNKYDWKAVVEFGNPNSLYSWGYQLKPIGEFEYNTDILCWIGMEDANIYCEVVGNIYENPELAS